MVIEDQQTEGTRGKDQGILQAPTTVLLTDQILTIHQGQKTTIAPLSRTGKRGPRRGSNSNRRKPSEGTFI